MNRRFRIGVTGGIGTGKTYVANLIHRSFGIPVYNTDAEAKRLMTESPEIREQLLSLLGTEVYLPTGQLNRDLMRRFVFSNEKNVKAVNAIVHPAVRRDFLRWADAVALTTEEAALQQQYFTQQVVAVESALLVEAQLTEDVDSVLLVTASLKTRINRTMQRDGLSEHDVLQRINHQLSDVERLPFVHYIVTNDDNTTDLAEQLQRIMHALTASPINKDSISSQTI